MNSNLTEASEICRILHVLRESLLQEEICKEMQSDCSECMLYKSASDTMSRRFTTMDENERLLCRELVDKVEELIATTVETIGRKEPPYLTFGNTRSWNNIRDIYYQDVQLYGSQNIVNDIVDDISCMLKVPRWNLHILATSKGCIAGDLQFRDYDGNIVDCNKTDTGILVPNHVTAITNMTTQAKYILIVEKDATFQKLLDESFYQRGVPCILITGKGFPDVNTRLMVHRLWQTFHLPTFVLVDADPHGVEIMAVYKYGSRALSFDTHHLAVPVIRWLGVLPSDVCKLQVREEYLLKLSARDIQKAKELLSRPYIAENGPVRNELELILKLGVKAEIQCLNSLGSSFLTEVYISNKILSQAWI